VAIVHDWLTGMRGGEKVLDAICELYPDATLYTLVRVPGRTCSRIEHRRIRTSIVQRFPAAGRLYRNYLFTFPTAIELFDLDAYDLVISSSHCAAKSIVPTGRAVHICYCHSPMRYAWDQFGEYFGSARVGRWRSRLLRPALAAMARWDAATAGRVDRFVANSQYVAGRIRRYYNRGSTVVYPPVDTAFYTPGEGDSHRQDAPFLIVSALVPYKRLEVAVEACRKAGAPLKIVGTGPELGHLRGIAGPNVEFMGWGSDEEVRDLYRRARAVLLPGVEDFGMVPVEAQACGTPVVALGRGGAAETVIHGVTGVLVDDASPAAFAAALEHVRELPRDRRATRANAERFSKNRFMTEFQAAVASAIREDEQQGMATGEASDSAARRSPGGDSADREDSRVATGEASDSAARRSPSGNSADREDKQ
jgi:glycosyltransferase involved in cell wall biosynthesis